ncbi:MAG: hypothetical protein AB1512_24740 [Thermodesulfobacteriota bacterium]
MGRWIVVLSLGLFLLGSPAGKTCSAVAREAVAERLDRDRTDGSFEDMERQLRDLLQELEKLESEATEKLRKELIPMLKKEIRKLKKWLREFRFREKEKPEPVWTWHDRLRRLGYSVRTRDTA